LLLDIYTRSDLFFDNPAILRLSCVSRPVFLLLDIGARRGDLITTSCWNTTASARNKTVYICFGWRVVALCWVVGQREVSVYGPAR